MKYYFFVSTSFETLLLRSSLLARCAFERADEIVHLIPLVLEHLSDDIIRFILACRFEHLVLAPRLAFALTHEREDLVLGEFRLDCTFHILNLP